MGKEVATTAWHGAHKKNSRQTAGSKHSGGGTTFFMANCERRTTNIDSSSSFRAIAMLHHYHSSSSSISWLNGMLLLWMHVCHFSHSLPFLRWDIFWRKNSRWKWMDYEDEMIFFDSETRIKFWSSICCNVIINTWHVGTFASSVYMQIIWGNE